MLAQRMNMSVIQNLKKQFFIDPYKETLTDKQRTYWPAVPISQLTVSE